MRLGPRLQPPLEHLARSQRILIDGNECYKQASGKARDSGISIARVQHSTLPVEDLTIRNIAVRARTRREARHRPGTRSACATAAAEGALREVPSGALEVALKGDVVVPDGETWLIGANVQIAGNLRTHNGTIAMRAGSSLKFVGSDPAHYVGGGMHFIKGAHDNDIDLWIEAGSGARGMLDSSARRRRHGTAPGAIPRGKRTTRMRGAARGR